MVITSIILIALSSVLLKWTRIKHIQERGLDIAEYLEEEEIPILIENTPTLQKRAFLA